MPQALRSRADVDAMGRYLDELEHMLGHERDTPAQD
jgi:hypothetical protein